MGGPLEDEQASQCRMRNRREMFRGRAPKECIKEVLTFGIDTLLCSGVAATLPFRGVSRARPMRGLGKEGGLLADQVPSGLPVCAIFGAFKYHLSGRREVLRFLR